MLKEYKCYQCDDELKSYRYYNPVSEDIITMLCPVCAKDIIKEDGWEEFDYDAEFEDD